MSRYVQAHLLTVYPPSNPNRDESGRPKTVRVGGVERLRLSSQAVKRAVRTSEEFELAVGGRLGKRTQRLGEVVMEHLLGKGVKQEQALAASRSVAGLFGKLKGGDDDLQIEQLVFLTPDEREAALKLADDIVEGKLKDAKLPEIRVTASHAVDVALFGRMLAKYPEFNMEAAAAVSHAFSTHAAAVEDDYYSAVDDLRDADESRGSSFIGEQGYGSAVHYLYASVNKDLLLRNLGKEAPGSAELASLSVKSLIEALATASPSGKRASFAHNPRASFVMVEVGDQQPRNLASAFLKPIAGTDVLKSSVDALTRACADMDVAYGPCATARAIMAVGAGCQPPRIEGFDPEMVRSLAEISAFAASR